MFWYDDGRRNRLADHGNEFQTRYDAVWDSEYLYFGAWVSDNVNDVEARRNENKASYLREYE